MLGVSQRLVGLPTGRPMPQAASRSHLRPYLPGPPERGRSGACDAVLVRHMDRLHRRLIELEGFVPTYTNGDLLLTPGVGCRR